MSKQTIEERAESRVCCGQLEDWVRDRIQGWGLLGAHLLQNGDTADGLRHWWIAFEADEGQLRIAYGISLVRELLRNGRDREAAELNQQVEKLWKQWLGQDSK